MTSEWQIEPLQSVVSYIAKGIPPAYVEVEGENTVRVLNQKCNRDFAISYAESRLHDLSKRIVPQEKYLQSDDILINSTGTGTAGRIAQLHTVPCPTIVDGHMIVLRANEKVTPRYLGYALKAQQATVLQLDEGSTGQTELNRTRLLSELEVSYPVSLDVQNNIVATLSALDDRISVNKAINHHLEQMAQAIFKSWFLDFEPWGGVIPSDWREVQLADVCDVKGGKRLPKGENLTTTPNSHPYIRVRDMNNALYVQMNDAIEYVNDEIQHSISRYIVAADDIIVSIVGTIGMVCKVHPSMNNANLTENCVKLTNLHEVTSDFLYLFLSSPDGQEAIRRGTVGAVQAKLPIKNIQAITIMCPPANVMTDFDCFVSQAMLMIANNCTENQRLATLRDTLLPRLMSGELSVANLEFAK